ncbi:MAG: SRPBCC family protein [Egibacteraceae bacterium]
MLIENEFEVAAPLDKVWEHLLDVPRIAPCMPGAELTEVVSDNEFKGRVTTKLGPVSLRFSGTAKIVERDEAARRIVIHASGSEEKGKGQASMSVTSTLAPSGEGTLVKVSQDIQVSGAAAQFGRGMISDVTKVLMGNFASCIAANIDRESRGEASAQVAAAPAQGFSIGFKAMIMAFKRFFGRLFGAKAA